MVEVLGASRFRGHPEVWNFPACRAGGRGNWEVLGDPSRTKLTGHARPKQKRDTKKGRPRFVPAAPFFIAVSMFRYSGPACFRKSWRGPGGAVDFNLAAARQRAKQKKQGRIKMISSAALHAQRRFSCRQVFQWGLSVCLAGPFHGFGPSAGRNPPTLASAREQQTDIRQMAAILGGVGGRRGQSVPGNWGASRGAQVRKTWPRFIFRTGRPKDGQTPAVNGRGGASIGKGPWAGNGQKGR